MGYQPQQFVIYIHFWSIFPCQANQNQGKNCHFHGNYPTLEFETLPKFIVYPSPYTNQ